MPYVPALDGLRGIAVALVVCAHVVPGFTAGRVGVDVFFVLSGYLITTILLREWTARGRIDLRAFYLRRLLRLGPPLAVVLAAYILATPVWVSRGVTLEQLTTVWVAAATYTWNLLIVGLGVLPTGAAGALSHLWSLGQEEQFYLVFPLVLVLVLRRRSQPRVLLRALLGLAVVMLLLYVLTAGTLFAEFGPVTRGFGLLVGSALAVGRWGGQAYAVRRWLALGAVLVVGIVITGAVLRWLPGDADIPAAVCVAVLVIAHVTGHGEGALSRLLAFRPLVWLGLVSYSLYLWHLPLVVLAADVWHLGSLGVAAFALPTALALAELTRRLVEEPAARVKERWVRARTAPGMLGDPAPAALE
ncbi:acyltransferase [Terrabacter terrigena]